MNTDDIPNKPLSDWQPMTNKHDIAVLGKLAEEVNELGSRKGATMGDKTTKTFGGKRTIAAEVWSRLMRAGPAFALGACSGLPLALLLERCRARVSAPDYTVATIVAPHAPRSAIEQARVEADTCRELPPKSHVTTVELLEDGTLENYEFVCPDAPTY